MNSDRGPGTLRGQGQADPTAADGEPVTSHRHSTLLRNFSVLMMSQVTTWTIALLGVAVIPRYLGAELIGRLHIATSLWALALVVVIFGVWQQMIVCIAFEKVFAIEFLAATAAG